MRISARRSAAILDLHDLRFLSLHRGVHLLQMVVVQLLDVLLGVLLLVLGDVLGLLDPADRLGAGVADRDAACLGELVHDLYELPAAFFGQGGNRDADDAAVVGGREAEIGRENRLLNRLEERLVPRLDGQELGLGRGHARHLTQGHFAPVRLHLHEIQERGRGLAAADRGELPLHGLDCPGHELLGLTDMVLQPSYRGHCTTVPTRSPASTLAVAPGSLMLNTTMGSLFSLQRPNAFASITAYPLTIASRKEDRKSTRLNSSHTVISYAVFCWKKKTEARGVRMCVTAGCDSICLENSYRRSLTVTSSSAD